MEVATAVGLAGAVNSAVRAATGKSIAQNCWSLIGKARSKVLGTVSERLAEEAWKKAEEAITGAERKERVAFSQQLAALGRTLRNLEAPIVEDEAVKGALDVLYRSLERAVEGTDAAVERGRAYVEIQGYAQNLDIAMTAASAKCSDASAAAEMMSLDEINAGVKQLLANEGATQERFVYDPYDSDDSDQEKSLLGEGSFGATHKMKNTDDGCVYAVKLMKIKKTGVGVMTLREETARLSRMNHPNIVRYFTAFRYKKDKFFAIAMEYLTGGSLLDRIEQECGPLTSGQRPRETRTAQ